MLGTAAEVLAVFALFVVTEWAIQRDVRRNELTVCGVLTSHVVLPFCLCM